MPDLNDLEKQLEEANEKIAYLKREITHVLCSMDDSPETIESAKNHLRYIISSK